MKPYILSLIVALILWELFALMPHGLPKGDTGPYRLGAIHVHSTFSDGGGSVEEIAADATEADLDFVVLTDHNNIRALHAQKERAYGDLDVFVESEISTLFGHALAFYTDTKANAFPENQIRPETDLHVMGKRRLDDRAFLVAAHPYQKKNPWTRFDLIPEGFEVMNFNSLWQEQLSETPASFLFTALLFPMNNHLALLRYLKPSKKNLALWNTLSKGPKRYFGTVAPDSHSRVILHNGRELRWPSYRMTFKMGANAVRFKEPLGKTFAERKRQLYRALSQGQNALTFPLVYPFRGNDWKVDCNGKTGFIGDTVEHQQGCTFEVALPDKLPFSVTLKLFRNGELIQEQTGQRHSTQLKTEGPGTYRLEVWANLRSPFRLVLARDVPYVLYNPIYLTAVQN